MDLTNLISSEELQENKKAIKKIFFYRVCGTGMGAAACLLKKAGYDIEGADIKFAPPMGDYLKTTGIRLYGLESVDEVGFFEKYDLIVVGNVVRRDSEEAKLIENSGVKFCSFPMALGSLYLKGVNVVGIAGTHGKTTTAYLMSQVFRNLGVDAGHFIGGVINDNSPAVLGDGSYFFIESDEYDSAYFEKISKFRSYELNNLILTSLEFDHADIFSSIEDIKEQFRSILEDIDRDIVFNSDYPASIELYNEYRETYSKKWIGYGIDSNLGPEIIKEGSEGTTFKLVVNKKSETFTTNLVGTHNILNLSSVIIFSLLQNFSVGKIKKSICNLNLVKRRQEVRGVYNGSIVIDDFAHHPRAVELTIDSIKTTYPDKVLNVILDPSSATARSNMFQDEFAHSLGKADNVIIARPRLATTAKNLDNLNCNKISSALNENVEKSVVADDIEKLMLEIDKLAKPESILLVLSNSTCLGLWESSFVDNLQ